MIALSTIALVATMSAGSTTQVGSTVCDAVWRDEARTRDVPVRIRMPAGTSRAPLVLFSHGLGGTLDAGTTWAKAWGMAGIAVIHLQHAGSDAGLWAGETTNKGRLAALKTGMNGEQLAARVADVRFVIRDVGRRAAAVPVGACDLRRLDMTRVGMAGHSFGAATAQAVAGQRFGGRSMAVGGVKAAIAFSPVAPRQGDDTAAFSGITIPFLSVTGTLDTNPGGLNGTTPADRLRPYAAMPSGEKYLAVYRAGDHQIFGGRGVRRAAKLTDDHIIASTARLTTLFWRKALLGETKLKINAPSSGLDATDMLSVK